MHFWTGVAALCSAAVCAGAGGNLVPNPSFQAGSDGKPAGWSVWSPRPALAPRATAGGDELRLTCPEAACYGKWTARVAGIGPDKTYRFEVLYQPQAIEHDDVSVAAMLSWSRDGAWKTALRRDYIDLAGQSGGWRKLSRQLQAPQGATAVTVELVLRWAKGGSVSWKAPLLVETEPAGPRPVRVVTTHAKPQSGATLESNLHRSAELLDQAGAQKADLVLLTETFLDWGAGVPIETSAQRGPAMAVRLMSEKARQYKMWVAGSVNESVGGEIFNTAILVDRRGEVAAKYRKTHLPLTEAESGVSPGADYPVVNTDFGRVGLLVCWDNWFPEAARMLRLKGAEIVLLPIAGDGDPRHWDVISRARALDNGIYLVSSNAVGKPQSRVINPAGEVVAEVTADFGIATANLNLNQEWRLRWLSVGPGEGEPRSLYIKERRPDAYSPLAH